MNNNNNDLFNRLNRQQEPAKDDHRTPSQESTNQELMSSDQKNKNINRNKVNRRYERKRPQGDGPWLMTTDNIIWAVVLILMFMVAGITQWRTNVIKQNDRQLNVTLATWKDKLSNLEAKNSRTIYLPKAGNVNLTSEQRKSITFLNSFFAQVTTFTSQTSYETNYQMAKNSGIHDKEFWNGFLEPPVDRDGMKIVDAENVRMKNIRTQVIVTGKDTYLVTATYIPYHNESDLYQERKLQTRTYVFDVQGQVGNWSKMRLMKDIDMNAQTVTAGELE